MGALTPELAEILNDIGLLNSLREVRRLVRVSDDEVDVEAEAFTRVDLFVPSALTLMTMSSRTSRFMIL